MNPAVDAGNASRRERAPDAGLGDVNDASAHPRSRFRKVIRVDLHQTRRSRPNHNGNGAVGEVWCDPMTATWYVTFEVRKRGLLLRQRSPRETKTFATEAEAKLFARAKLDEGLAVFAGTINPHLPRRLISSSHIAAWLAEGQDSDKASGTSAGD